MEIVVDTNVIISALLKDGLTRKIIFLAPFDMYTIPLSRLKKKLKRTSIEQQ